MILSLRASEFSVPHTSSCIITTKGTIKDGDTVSVISPVFPSHNMTVYSLKSSDSFEVPVKILNESGTIESNGETTGTLVCDDNDVHHMYVRIF